MYICKKIILFICYRLYFSPYVNNTKSALTRFLWRQRDSNPRPNKEPICFLHAYLGLDFRATARPKPLTIALSANISFQQCSLPKPVPIFPHRLTHSASGRWLGAMSRFSTLCRNQANLLYFDYAARATVLLPVIMANPINERCSCSACLHTCSTCCQNQISPLFIQKSLEVFE